MGDVTTILIGPEQDEHSTVDVTKSGQDVYLALGMWSGNIPQGGTALVLTVDETYRLICLLVKAISRGSR